MNEEIIEYHASDSDNLTQTKYLLREIVKGLRVERNIADIGPEFKRRMSLAITNIEQAIMWVNATQGWDFEV